MFKPLRILYAAGPGDVIKTYNYWVQGQDDPSQVSVTYSGQFYDVCRALNAQAYVISSHRPSQILHEGQFTIEHRPISLSGASGILYHLSQLWYGLRLIVSAVRFRANVAVVAEGTTHWFILSLLPWLGVKLVPTIHCVLWLQYLPRTTIDKVLLRISRNLFAKDCTAILVASEDISKQIVEITSGKHQPIKQFLPTYKKEQFKEIVPPSENRSLFKVLFVGRIEQNKGVFDLLEIAKGFADENKQNIIFDLCGDGSALDSIRFAAKQTKVDSSFVCHGHCNKQKMRQMFSQAHVIIVPTRTDFVEGFNQVVVEGILSGRPVITSAVCPAISSVQSAVVEVLPNDTKGYGDALLKLYSDRQFYEQKRQASLGLQEQFYDISQSWGAKLKSILMTVQEEKST